MRITPCLWRKQFIEKLGHKHGVLQDEVEEVFVISRATISLLKAM